jgi:hypothetical protein
MYPVSGKEEGGTNNDQLWVFFFVTSFMNGCTDMGQHRPRRGHIIFTCESIYGWNLPFMAYLEVGG